MIFDTDVLIWLQRGNLKAAKAIEAAELRRVSVQTWLELMQCATDKRHLHVVKRFFADLEFQVLPLTENIGSRAMVYMEEYGLSHGLTAGDAIIAATATERGLPLATGNVKHFKAVRDLDLRPFKP